jgi:ABC-type transporter Mla MlaB component
MAFVTEYQTEGARVVLSGELTVADASALHAALSELREAAGIITVDDTRVTSCDVTLLQLLLAFGRARRAAGRGLVMTSGPAVRKLADLGLGAELPGA